MPLISPCSQRLRVRSWRAGERGGHANAVPFASSQQLRRVGSHQSGQRALPSPAPTPGQQAIGVHPGRDRPSHEQQFVSLQPQCHRVGMGLDIGGNRAGPGECHFSAWTRLLREPGYLQRPLAKRCQRRRTRRNRSGRVDAYKSGVSGRFGCVEKGDRGIAGTKLTAERGLPERSGSNRNLRHPPRGRIRISVSLPGLSMRG